jgi:MoaA/NifB/PqqE/SkfB family radical SAM enzyme
MDIILPPTIPIKSNKEIELPFSGIPITVDKNGIKHHPILENIVRIDLDLTGLCNRQCSFCPRSLDADPVYPNVNKQMSLETIEIILQELRSINFRGWFELAGRGESTLHKKFEQIVDMITQGPRKWKVRLTTNGYRIDEWWNSPVAEKLDELYLNSYESKEEYLERQKLYPMLPNGGIVRHYYKQDGFTIDEINNMPSYIEGGKSWKHAFNNRAGYFKNQDRRNKDLNYTNLEQKENGNNYKVSESSCWHPMRQIFIDYEGNYQMCCNDWSYQIKIGNVHERSLIDMYVNDPKLNRIRWFLLNKQRDPILPCAKCDDIQGATKQGMAVAQKFKQSECYKRHVVPSAQIGKTYDQGLRNGV